MGRCWPSSRVNLRRPRTCSNDQISALKNTVVRGDINSIPVIGEKSGRNGIRVECDPKVWQTGSQAGDEKMRIAMRIFWVIARACSRLEYRRLDSMSLPAGQDADLEPVLRPQGHVSSGFLKADSGRIHVQRSALLKKEF